MSRPVSRVLSWTAIHLCRLPETSDGPPIVSIWRCSGRGLPSRTGHPARWWSLTPPFHPYRVGVEFHINLAVCSLWRYPAGHPGLPLATVLPFGARTFLSLRRGRPTGSEPSPRIERGTSPLPRARSYLLSYEGVSCWLPLSIWDSLSSGCWGRTNVTEAKTPGPAISRIPIKSPGPESNRRPSAYKADALAG